MGADADVHCEALVAGCVLSKDESGVFRDVLASFAADIEALDTKKDNKGGCLQKRTCNAPIDLNPKI